MISQRYVICDIEATGLHEKKEIIEIAMITYENGKITDIYETLVNPLTVVSPYIYGLTGISQKELQNAPKFYEVAENIRLRLEGSIFVSHNIDFDYQILRKKFLEMGQEIKLKTFCTLQVAKFEIPGLKSYQLDALCHFFGIKLKQHHRAISDAQATLEIFHELSRLRYKTHSEFHYLPHHEKYLSKLPSRAGLITFKDAQGKVIHSEAATNMEKRARELLVMRPENRELLMKTQALEAEVTGMALIAEFKKIHTCPYRPRWMICLFNQRSGEKFFKLIRYKKNLEGLWYFENLTEAKKKMSWLKKQLHEKKYLYREGGKSKEDIIRENQKMGQLARMAMFPSDDLLIWGEGPSLGEISFVLVRQGHVLGHGHGKCDDKELWANPERYMTNRFFHDLGADLLAKRYLLELKNRRDKSEAWRSLAQVESL